jgi:hypothetical protein
LMIDEDNGAVFRCIKFLVLAHGFLVGWDWRQSLSS